MKVCTPETCAWVRRVAELEAGIEAYVDAEQLDRDDISMLLKLLPAPSVGGDKPGGSDAKPGGSDAKQGGCPSDAPTECCPGVDAHKLSCPVGGVHETIMALNVVVPGQNPRCYHPISAIGCTLCDRAHQSGQPLPDLPSESTTGVVCSETPLRAAVLGFVELQDELLEAIDCDYCHPEWMTAYAALKAALTGSGAT